MSDRLLSSFWITAVFGALCIAPVAALGADAEEEVYTILKAGKELSEAKKENDRAVASMAKELESKRVEDANLKVAEANRKAYVADFSQRCARQFVRGEEAVMAACQAERNERNPQGQLLKEKRGALDSWFNRFELIKQKQIEINSQMALWKARMRINAALAGCAPSGDSLEHLVHQYQICFDGQTGAQPLSSNPAMGTRVTPNAPR